MNRAGQLRRVLVLALAWSAAQAAAPGRLVTPLDWKAELQKGSDLVAKRDFLAAEKHVTALADRLSRPLPGDRALRPDDVRRIKLALGNLFFRADCLTEAHKQFVDCLEHYEQQPSQDLLERPTVLYLLATVEARKGWYRDADHHFSEALQALDTPDSKTVDSGSFGREALRAKLCDGQGVALANLGRYSQAAEKHAEAIRCWSKWTQDETLSRKERTQAEDGWYLAHLNRATVYKSQGRRAKAIATCEALVEELTQRFGTNDVRFIKLYSALADSCIGEGRLKEARHYAEESLRIARDRKDRWGEVVAEHHLATIDFGEASRDPDKRRRDDGLKKAEEAWKRLLKYHEEKGNTQWIGRTARCLGDVALAQGDRKGAVDWYRLAMKMLDATESLPVARYNAKFGLAIALSQCDAKEQQEAISHLEEAITIIEAAGAATLGAEFHRDRFFDQFADACDLLVKLLLQQGNARHALFYADKFRNRTLGDELQLSQAGAGVDLLRTVPPAMADRLDRLLRERGELQSAIARNKAPPDAVGQLRRIEAAFQQLRNDVRDASPVYRRILGQTADYETFLQEVEALGRDRQAVLYYYLGNLGNYLWVVTGAGVEVYELTNSEQNAAELTRSPKDGRSGLMKTGTGSATDCSITGSEPLTVAVPVPVFTGFSSGHGRGPAIGSVPPARSVAEQLVSEDAPDSPGRENRGVSGPVPQSQVTPPRRFNALAPALTETLLPAVVRQKILDRGCEHVVIVPDRALHQVPFQALVTGRKRGGSDGAPGVRYLIDEPFPPISYAPSLRVLSLLQARSSRQQPKGRVLTVGGNYGGLPYSEPECSTVAGLFPDLVVTPPLISRRARERLIGLYAPQCRFFHFSNHAHFENKHDNLFGYLALYGGEKLELHEVFNLDLHNCELAVLSACETNVGPQRQTNTGNSLARAFLAAGSARVVASFWRPGDEATCQLMSRFFEEVGAGMRRGDRVDYAAALRTAMRGMRNGPNAWHRRPEFWAPFALIGPPQAASKGTGPELQSRN